MLNKTSHIHVLLIEDNEPDAKLLRQLLDKSSWASFDVARVSRLSEGLKALETTKYDVVLLDLALPDAQGLDTFRSVRSRFPSIAIIVLTGLDDEAIAFEAVAAGAQDYLVKGQIPGGLLARAILYALERHQANEKIKHLNAELEDRIIELAGANKELEETSRIAELTRDQALQASNFKSEFVAKMSHEIRTPIAALISVLELMKTESSPSESLELLHMANESAHCLLDVINDVLDLSKIEAGKIELQISDYSPTALVEEVGDLFAVVAQKKELRLMTYVDPRIPDVLAGDPIRLRQILLNFVSNAVKFTSRGEILLRATVESVDAQGVNVRFSVTDSGCGIAQGAIGQLFQPFVQLGNQHTLGTGLGLSICKRLVELMGGQIGVQSTEAKGSTFWFCLRFKRCRKARAGTPFHFEQARQLFKPAAHRVLVLSDNLAQRNILHSYVCATGLRNGTAASSNEALDMLRHADLIDDAYKVVLVNLNAADAFVFAAEVHEDPSISSTQLVYIARPGTGNSKEAWKAGFSTHQREPIHQAQLVDCLVKLLCTGDQYDASPADKNGEAKAENAQAERATRILLAEDSDVIQKLVCVQLGRLGIDVTAVDNGKQAVLEFGRRQYSLILMDISMPEMNGLEAAQAIRRIESSTNTHIPIVALTARTMADDRKRCLEAGMDDYIAKPVTLEQLRQIIQRWTWTTALSDK